MPTEYIPEKLRKQVIKRARGYCEYCRCPDSVTNAPFSVDHIIPKVKGGKTVLSNLAYACYGCNNKKRDKRTAFDPFTRKRVALFHPRKQKWIAHFGWSEDFKLVIGLTPTGRATVEAIGLNRFGVVNLRDVLRNSGHHPPEEF
jgi:hypothetical protein